MNLRNLIIVTMALALTGLAAADNGEFTVAGATQFDFFFSFGETTPAATHDYINVDGDADSILGNGNIDQLAQKYAAGDQESEIGPWVVNYRGTGSGTGLEELIEYWNTAPDCADLADADTTVNRTGYGASACGYPFTLERIDMATMDVPTSQFVQLGAENQSDWQRKPFQDGYGHSPVTPWDANSVTGSNKLAELTGGLNINQANPDAGTIFDFKVAWFPFYFAASRATGIENVTLADLQYCYLTGRMANGLNIDVGSRHSGSGTRNACMSSIGVDPSWGRGDNLGKVDKPSNKNLRDGYRYNNITSSSTLRDLHRNNRFMMSYQTLYGSKGTPKINDGWYECVNIEFIPGSGDFVRPEEQVDLAYIPDEHEDWDAEDQPNYRDNTYWTNAPNGWKIGGSETLATVGDPYATDFSTEFTSVGTYLTTEGLVPAHSFGMVNPSAAAFLINLNESIKDVQEIGTSPATSGSPGQALANKSTMTAGIYYLPNPDNPAEFILNDGFNEKLAGLPISKRGLDAYGVNGVGFIPNRDAGAYLTLAGDSVASPLAEADYDLQGDIDGDDAWTTADLCAAVDILVNGAAASVDTGISYDILGDFDNDGVFDADDVRFMADGVIGIGTTAGIVDGTGMVDRAANFAAVDMCAEAGGNFFGTTLANGSYDAGDSMADIAVAGSIYAQAGAAPVGDNTVDQTDISYIQKVLTGRMMDGTVYVVGTNGLDWNDKDDAVFMDLSCDMNGDYKVTEADLRIVVEDVLETRLGDFDLDGDVDADDRQTIVDNLDSEGTYIDGDITGDGDVSQADLEMFDCGALEADFNNDCEVNLEDFATLAGEWLI